MYSVHVFMLCLLMFFPKLLYRSHEVLDVLFLNCNITLDHAGRVAILFSDSGSTTEN